MTGLPSDQLMQLQHMIWKNNEKFSSHFNTRIKKEQMEPELCLFVGGVVSCLVKPRPPVRAITGMSFDVEKKRCSILYSQQLYFHWPDPRCV